MNISIFYEKQDTYKTIKDLTYHIGNVGVDIKENNNNRQDIDIASYTYNDAKYIRRELQVNNEDLYYLYIYINIPIMENNNDIKNIAKRNILTSGLLATYPFISSTMFDAEGIFIGKNIYNESLVFIDRYDNSKYKNANMCVFGTSGAGKSFYIKLTIIRYRLFGIEQYVIDPEREYINLCKQLKGTEIKIGPTSKTYINVFDIRKESIEDNTKGYLANKIRKIIRIF